MNMRGIDSWALCSPHIISRQNCDVPWGDMGGITHSSPCFQVHTVGKMRLPINFRADCGVRTRANSDFCFSESRNITVMSKLMSVYLYEGLLFCFFFFVVGGCWFVFCAIATSCTEFKSNFIYTRYRNKLRELKLYNITQLAIVKIPN